VSLSFRGETHTKDTQTDVKSKGKIKAFEPAVWTWFTPRPRVVSNVNERWK